MEKCQGFSVFSVRFCIGIHLTFLKSNVRVYCIQSAGERHGRVKFKSIGKN